MVATAHPHYGPPVRPDPGQVRVHLDPVNVADRLTARDRWLLRMLAEHRVLTTHHVTDLAFTTARKAEKRLLILYRFGLVDRFRPFASNGTAPWHYVLTQTGAAHLDEATLLDTGYRPRRALDIAAWPILAHVIGTTSVFTTLARVARIIPDSRLGTWWPEHRCAAAWDGLIRPDGYGVWAENGSEVAFFLEYDTGSEPLHRLVAKLSGYTRLAATTGFRAPVLFWLPSSAREDHLHQLLPNPGVPVATTTPTSADHPHGPAGPVWLRAGGVGPRHRLAHFAPTPFVR